VLDVPGAPQQDVYVGIRPEGYVLRDDGPFSCSLQRVEVMGRDISVVVTHPNAVSEAVRCIVPAENHVDPAADRVRFALKPNKVYLFDKATEARIPFDGQ